MLLRKSSGPFWDRNIQVPLGYVSALGASCINLRSHSVAPISQNAQYIMRKIAPSALTYPSGLWVLPISQCTVYHA